MESITAQKEPHPRCLSVLFDLGNPTMLSGLVWWQEYGFLLKRTGHLSSILKAKCLDRMQFGDCPSRTPLFVALQVPLWYRCTDGSSLLVFSNIRIVPHCVGLLDGKQNMAALGLTCKLATDSHAKFLRQGKEIAYADEGGHFYLILDAPRIFDKTRTAWPCILITLMAFSCHMTCCAGQ
jgi:hypothetical protein